MRFTLSSLVAVAALAVSTGSVQAQRTHGGFTHPMMNANPHFNTSPFVMNPGMHSGFVNPRFNTPVGGHASFNATAVNSRSSIAGGAQANLNASAFVNPRFVATSAFHQSMVVAPTNLRTGGLVVGAQRNTLYIPPSFGPTGAIALPPAGQVQLASLGLISPCTSYIPTGGYGTLPLAGQVQLASLGLLPYGLSPFDTTYGTTFGVTSSFSFWNSSFFSMPWLW